MWTRAKMLKGGFKANDPRLDRLPSFDVRSLNYPIRTLMAPEQLQKPRSYTWGCSVYLDQGTEGACVGFSVAHEIAARPASSPVNEALALQIYRAAQLVDEWPGQDYSGTSVLAGIKTASDKGYFGEYRWAFGLQDLILALGYKGPAVLGVNWYTGMLNTDSEGYVHVTGNIEGGHAILANGVSIPKRRIRLHNSWGTDWGVKGDAWISFDDMERLLIESGEACIPVLRKKVSLV